jgi:hypothetical protein
MNTLTMVMAVAMVVSAFPALPAFAADDAALMKDLTAVIALHGLPCGQVVAVKVQAENDYAASCQDANKYRVYLNAAGRVIVEKK